MLVAFVTVFLSGCDGDKTPSEKVTGPVVRQYAESGIRDVEIADYQRDNGWVDTSAPNRYDVQYKYNWELKKPFPQVLLEHAQDVRRNDEDELSGLALADTMFGMLDKAMAAAEASGAQGSSASDDPYQQREAALFKRCRECAVWLTQGDDNEKTLRSHAFMLAWKDLENLGYADDAPAGVKVPRTAWAAFSKTENGWEAAK